MRSQDTTVCLMNPHLALQVAAKGPSTVESVGTAAAMPVQRSQII